jgi:hypothetical protein
VLCNSNRPPAIEKNNTGYRPTVTIFNKCLNIDTVPLTSVLEMPAEIDILVLKDLYMGSLVQYV